MTILWIRKLMDNLKENLMVEQRQNTFSISEGRESTKKGCSALGQADQLNYGITTSAESWPISRNCEKMRRCRQFRSGK